METIVCQQCGLKNVHGATHCESCHSLLGVNCKECETWNSAALNYCQTCGTPLKIASGDVEITSDAERRYLNVMFCDLVGSTTLSETLDPEELRDIVVAYQDMCAKAIEEQGGYIAQYLGDGILVYFGYPKTHEDETRRTVKAALRILENIRVLNEDSVKKGKTRVAVRIGIHSGLVVIGDIGHGSKRERLALGETPNIAARVQSLAEPGSVLITGETYKIVNRYFHCRKKGTHLLKGISNPVTVYEPFGEIEMVEQLQPEVVFQPKLIGRRAFTNQLLSKWNKVASGNKEVVLIRGEAGIGKTHFMTDFVSSIPDEQSNKVILRFASHTQNNAFAPLIQVLLSLTGIHENETDDQRLGKLESFLSSARFNLDEDLPVIASLLSVNLSSKYQPLSSSVRLIQAKTKLLLKKIIYSLSESNPLILIFDDLQWSDPSSLELVTKLVNDTTNNRILYLLSYRTGFKPPFEISSSTTEVNLPNLNDRQITKLSEHIAGKKLPRELVELVIKKTDGVPLFVEELTRLILESDLLEELKDHFALKGSLPELSIPSTLQDLLIAKLDQLGKAKEVAQLGAVFGRDFTIDVMEAISSLSFDALSGYLKILVEEALLVIKGEAPYFLFSFKHVLVQEKAYQLLLKSRRQQYHLLIAESLEQDFSQFVKASPEFIAHHYTMAGKFIPAIQYWQKAGELALTKSSYLEAIVFFNKGMSLLGHLDTENERQHLEIQLLAGLAPALLTTRGYTDKSVEAAYTRVYELADKMKDVTQLASLLRGLWSLYTVKANHQLAFKIARRLNNISKGTNDLLIEFESCKALGGNFFWRGEFIKAKDQLAQTLNKFDPNIYYRHVLLYSEHPVVSCLTYQAFNSGMLGNIKDALTSSAAAVDYARKLNHPFTLVYALGFAASLAGFMRDSRRIKTFAGETLELAMKYGFAFWQNMGNIFHNWMVAESNPATGLFLMESAIRTMQKTGAQLWISCPMGVLAEMYGQAGQVDKGMNFIEEALVMAEKNDEKFYLAELHRVKGMLLSLSGSSSKNAEKHFRRSLEIAEKQGAKNFAVRTLVSLLGFVQNEKERDKAKQLLEAKLTSLPSGESSNEVNEAKIILKKFSGKSTKKSSIRIK